MAKQEQGREQEQEQEQKLPDAEGSATVAQSGEPSGRNPGARKFHQFYFAIDCGDSFEVKSTANSKRQFMNGSKRGVAPNDGADLTPSDDSSQPSDRDHSPRRVDADHTDHQGHLDHQDHPRGFGPRSHRDPLCRVVLVEPLIPENTGNISRTCVATNSELHLVEPMGFEISESRVKRAGLDYWADLAWQKHESTAAWRNSLPHGARVFLIETSGRRDIFEVEFQRGDWIVFGKETTGLSPTLLTGADAIPNAQVLSIPMPGTTRSLNLSNAVAVTVFELLRQTRTNR